MGLHRIKAGLMRPTLEQYEAGLIKAGNENKETQKQSLQEKREVVQNFAEIILMNDEGNSLPPHEIASRAIELYNKIEDYL